MTLPNDISDPGYAAVARQNTLIATWLYIVAGMVLAMIVLGGVTRLTHSGLSMVEWRPISGWLPPLSETEWRAAFESYKAFPEYKEMNEGMTLRGFKGIFWLEFLHRLWGRIIGVVFLLPFLIFVLRGWVDRTLGARLAGLFVLGAMQGVLGWYMVKSGLVDRPDVSQYRLAAHLCLALAIIMALIWVARGLNLASRQTWENPDINGVKGLRWAALSLLALIFLTAFSGALVAGLDAGLTYNTFPLMDGEWIPNGMYDMQPTYLNLFENVTTVQFDHRVLAVTTFISIVAFWIVTRRHDLAGSAALSVHVMLGGVLLQVTLGIITLLLVVPVVAAALHQAVAVILLSAATWVFRELTPP